PSAFCGLWTELCVVWNPGFRASRSDTGAVAEADGNRTRQESCDPSPVLKTGGPTRRPDASVGDPTVWLTPTTVGSHQPQAVAEHPGRVVRLLYRHQPLPGRSVERLASRLDPLVPLEKVEIGGDHLLIQSLPQTVQPGLRVGHRLRSSRESHDLQ